MWVCGYVDCFFFFFFFFLPGKRRNWSSLEVTNRAIGIHDLELSERYGLLKEIRGCEMRHGQQFISWESITNTMLESSPRDVF